MLHQTWNYCDLSIIKDPGNLSDLSGVTTYDNMLLFWGESCSRFIDEFLHRHFYCWEGTKYFNGDGTTLNLPVDILSISEFKLDQDGSGNFATTLSATDYVLNPTNTYPKTYIKRSLVSSIGAFASNVPNGVKITGVFGYGTGDTATPYQDSGVTVNASGITSSATTHALATGKGATFAAGMLIRIGSEQLYITSVSTDILTFMRGCNGTTAAAHTAGDTIYIYQFNSAVVSACLVQLSIWWKRRESAYASKIGNTQTGEFETYRGLDDAVKQILLTGKLRRHVL